VIDGEDPAYQAKIRAIEPKVRAAIEEVLDGGDFDGHGSYGPIFIRLAWHASGTYDKESNTGGSNGSTMRFDPESKWGANNGLQAARDRLESVKQQFPEISYADLWTLAAVVAIEAAGGPAIVWRPGRSDAEPRGVRALPDGRLPDAAQGARHVREIFYRMGFNDREITALIGAHAMGKTHTANSGYEGPWTRAPTTFSNQFYVLLKEEKWRIRDWRGPKQYENDGKDLMMLPADMAFLWDSEFRKYTDLYAKDEEAFFKDFAAAYGKLLELGVPAFQKGDKKQ
jgi:catalase (peroxidase I)